MSSNQVVADITTTYEPQAIKLLGLLQKPKEPEKSKHNDKSC